MARFIILTRWEPVYHRLRGQPGHPLASALSTPLMVWLARTTYADPASNPAELADTTRFPHRVEAPVPWRVADERATAPHCSRD